MGKKKTAVRRDVADALGSPRTKAAPQDEPVTDTVMQVIARRIRNARKKLQRVSVLENLLEEGQTLNEDQERVYLTKAPLGAIIEELQKLEPLVEAALRNELTEQLRAAREEWTQEQGEDDAARMRPVPSEGAESDGNDEQTTEVDATATAESDKKETASEDEDDDRPVELDRGYDDVAEALYFLQLFVGDRFNVAPLTEPRADATGVLSQEEVELLERYGKKIFQTTAHVPSAMLISAKEVMTMLFSPSDPDAAKIFEICKKLKNSKVVEQEIKLAVRGFPLSIAKEVSDTTTDRTDKSEEDLKQESIPLTSAPPEPPAPDMSHENPPSTSPPQPLTSFHFTHPQDSAPMDPKGARPFLPFPAMGMTAGPPLRFGVTPPPNMMDMRTFYNIAPVPGPYLSPPLYTPAPSQAPATSYPLPAESKPEREEEKAETSSCGPTDPEPADDVPPPTEGEATEEEQPVVHPTDPPKPVTTAPVESAEGSGGQGPKPRPPPQQGGRFSHANYRPDWQPKGRHPYRGGPRGRGPRGRHSHPYGGPPRRPPFDPQQSHQQPRAPFMQSASGERHPYDPRGRQRRGGYDRPKDVGRH